jgi:hypothetical protein
MEWWAKHERSTSYLADLETLSSHSRGNGSHSTMTVAVHDSKRWLQQSELKSFVRRLHTQSQVWTAALASISVVYVVMR